MSSIKYDIWFEFIASASTENGPHPCCKLTADVLLCQVNVLCSLQKGKRRYRIISSLHYSFYDRCDVKAIFIFFFSSSSDVSTSTIRTKSSTPKRVYPHHYAGEREVVSSRSNTRVRIGHVGYTTFENPSGLELSWFIPVADFLPRKLSVVRFSCSKVLARQ